MRGLGSAVKSSKTVFIAFLAAALVADSAVNTTVEIIYSIKENADMGQCSGRCLGGCLET